MGANFRTMRLPSQTTRDQVKARFADAQDQDRYDNGHQYSGGFGQCSGLSFPPRTFHSRTEAVTWLEDNAQKWEDALCVTVREGEETFWLIGAWCAE